MSDKPLLTPWREHEGCWSRVFAEDVARGAPKRCAVTAIKTWTVWGRPDEGGKILADGVCESTEEAKAAADAAAWRWYTLPETLVPVREVTGTVVDRFPDSGKNTIVIAVEDCDVFEEGERVTVRAADGVGK